jgi:hypothetical protein
MLQPRGDAVGHRDDRGAARYREPLDPPDEPRPRAFAVRHARRQLMRVVDQLRAREACAEEAGQQHRRVVRVNHVRADLRQVPNERGQEDDTIGLERKRAADPRGRRDGHPGEAVELSTGVRVELEDRHGVARGDQSTRLSPHARIVCDRLVEQHRYAHRISAPVGLRAQGQGGGR